MTLKKGLILKEVAGSYIVVAVGSAVKTLNGIITLNKTGAFLWKELESDKSEQELIDALLSRFDVQPETAKKDVIDFITAIKNANLLA